MPSPELQKRYVKDALKGRTNVDTLEKAFEKVSDLRFALPGLACKY